uniref:Uncharacterized protein n=1 Tax=Oryza punctata TaxID=4537 RepID=A0A0E0KGE7_ORYPU
MGSRFWALNGDDTSDEDEACEEEGEVGLKLDGEVEECMHFVQRALKQGFAADEILKAGEQLLCIGTSPKVISCPEKVSKKKNGRLAKYMARVSEPRMVGDAIADAFKRRRSVNWGSLAIIDVGNGEQLTLAKSR